MSTAVFLAGFSLGAGVSISVCVWYLERMIRAGRYFPVSRFPGPPKNFGSPSAK